jgi:hypothetical protein
MSNGFGWADINRLERARRLRQRLALWATSTIIATAFLAGLGLLDRLA